MTYKKIILTIASVAVMTAPMAAFADVAPASVDAGSTASFSAPASVDAGSTASTGSAPASADAGSTAGSTSAPATSDAGSTAGSTSAPSTGPAGSTAGAGSNTGGSTTGSTGGSTTSSSGSSSSSGGSAVLFTSTNTGGGVITSCPLISSYMKLGASNNSSDVAKLQAFLKNNEQINVAVTGTFDAQTEAAVEAFQTKYLGDVMGPWGATQASGIVYITTMKKVNEISCKQPLTLSASDLAIINSYKANSASVASTSTSSVGPSAPASTSTGPFDNTVGSSVDQNSNTAAAGNASVMGRFWSFLKNLF